MRNKLRIILFCLVVNVCVASAAEESQEQSPEKTNQETTSTQNATSTQDTTSISTQDSAIFEDSIIRYKAKLYRLIGVNFKQAIHQSKPTTPYGRIAIKFFVHSDGTIDQLKITTGDNESNYELIKLVRQIICNISGKIGAFPECMKEINGDGYWDDANFNTL